MEINYTLLSWRWMDNELTDQDVATIAALEAAGDKVWTAIKLSTLRADAERIGLSVDL